ncbi:MAG: ABC transporter ATP-binding protein [Actinomycetota bacterium]|nr:ABC transporter ATP-binding protein [Actinomycetota bacterium]
MINSVNLIKKFDDITAVNNLNLNIDEVGIFGLIGPDGAGKTTLIRLMCGIMDPTGGDTLIENVSVKKYPEKIKLRIGYMPQRFSLYRDLTVMENLNFYADLYLVPGEERLSTIRKLLEFSNLSPFSDRLAENLSGGMKQKLGLACSLIHKPGILFLDEPTNGVDPLSRREFWSILKELKNEGTLIIISTPYMDEAEKCDRIGFMNKGSLIYTGTPAEFKKMYKGRLIEIVPSDYRGAFDILKNDKRIIGINIYGEMLHINLEENLDPEFIKKILKENNIETISMIDAVPGIEDVFVYFVKKS